MNVAKHLRILSTILIVLAGPVFALGVAVFVWAGLAGGEGALIGFPAAIGAMAAVTPLVAGIGMRYGKSWATVLSVICALLMLGSIVFAPLGAYALFVAYIRWTASPASLEDVPRVPTGEEIFRRFQASGWTTLNAHARILASAWVLFAIMFILMGSVFLLEAITDFGEKGFSNYLLYSGPVVLMLGAICMVLASAVRHRRAWAIWVTALAAVPLLTWFPLGTAVGAYALWIAFLTYRERRAGMGPG